MKEKGLFDGTADPDPVDGDDPQTHFASFRSRCEPIQAWLEARFGKVSHMGGWKYLSCRVHGVHVRVTMEDGAAEWFVGFQDKGTKRVGWTRYDGWEAKIPPAVWLAVDYVRLMGGNGS